MDCSAGVWGVSMNGRDGGKQIPFGNDNQKGKGQKLRLRRGAAAKGGGATTLRGWLPGKVDAAAEPFVAGELGDHEVGYVGAGDAGAVRGAGLWGRGGSGRGAGLLVSMGGMAMVQSRPEAARAWYWKTCEATGYLRTVV